MHWNRSHKAKPFSVLFVSGGNVAPALFAEAILNRLGGGEFAARSASRDEAAKVDFHALKILRKYNYRTGGLKYRSIAAFAGSKKLELDFVFDLSASRDLPSIEVWPGHPIVSRWNLPDPDMTSGGEAEKHKAYADCYGALYSRVSLFVTLPLRSLTPSSVRRWIDMIGAGKEPYFPQDTLDSVPG